MRPPLSNVVVTGMGVVSPIGIGLNEFAIALKEGQSNFSTVEFGQEENVFSFPMGKVNNFNFKNLALKIHGLNDDIIKRAHRLRNISTSTYYGMHCALEAWEDAGISNTDLTRVAIISSGSNTQQAALQLIQDQYREKIQFINPNYGLNFFDTDIIGVLSELLNIQGEGYSVGAASASGNMAIIQGLRLIENNQYDIVLVVAPLMDLSIYEYQGFTALGAMAKISKESLVDEVCRPFDTAHNGFVYGQCAGALILESEDHAAKRGKQAYGAIVGYGVNMDANRNPNPSVEGEKIAMAKAIKVADIKSDQINYINTHGTGSVIGDNTEAEAIISIGLNVAKANSTKSLIGHGLSAAGVVECIATLIQMNENFIHQNKNLITPISDKIDWVKDKTEYKEINYAMSNSWGFGGLNSSIIIEKIHYVFSEHKHISNL